MIIWKTIKNFIEYQDTITILFNDNTVYQIESCMVYDQSYMEGKYYESFRDIDLWIQEELWLITEEERIMIEEEEERIWLEKKTKQKKEQELKELKRLKKKYWVLDDNE